MADISRRSFFKKAGLLAGTALVAPKVLFELLPCDPRIAAVPHASTGVNFGGMHPLAVKRWAKTLQNEAEKQTYFHNFMSKQGSIIRLK